MHKQLLIVMLICLKGADYISAQQWTKKDSVWLQNVLSGKEKLELNPETMKAIQSGSFINLDEPASDMKMSPVTPLPILKDFTEYIQTDSTYRKIALKDLPPGVFWLYAPPPGKFLPVYKNMLEAWKNDPMNRSHNTGFVTFDFAEMTSRKSYIHKRRWDMEKLQQSTYSRHHQEKEETRNWSSGICQAGYAFVTQGFVAVKRHDTRNLLCSDELNSP